MAVSSPLHDLIHKSLRAVIGKCSRPQQKAVKEILLSIFREGTTVINHLTDTNRKVKVGKQAERLRHHLENIDISSVVEKRVWRTLPVISDDTVIAYDLGDIAKPCAKKMEGLHDIFDGSERKWSTGYMTHGVSIHDQPVIFRIHDHNTCTLNQTRLSIIDDLIGRFGTKGIWTFDRQNDDQKLFTALSERKVRFIIRLKKNRNLIRKDTGEIIRTEAFPVGRYEVIIPNTKEEYFLVVHQKHNHLPPIRVITNVKGVTKIEEVIETYLQRWDMENLYKQMKTKYDLESVRLLSLKKITNLLALVQLTTSINNLSFERSQKEEEQKSAIALAFRQYYSLRCLTPNRFSFADFLSTLIPASSLTKKKPTNQLSLLSWRQMGKMGVF